MSTFDRALDLILRLEGADTDDPFALSVQQSGHGLRQGLAIDTQSAVKRFVGHTRPLGDFAETDALAAPLHPNSVSFVAGLVAPRGPSAICRTVRAVHVDPVQRKPRWARTHVGNEPTKVFAPFWAHGDASSPVLRELGVARVLTSCLRVLPRSVFPRRTVLASTAQGVPMRSPRMQRLQQQAAAAHRPSRSKSFTMDGVLFAAIAKTQPTDATGRPVEWPKRNQTAKALAGNVVESHVQ